MADAIITDSKNREFKVKSADLLLPYRGNWTARVDISGEEEVPEGLVSLKWHDTTYVGYVMRAGTYASISTLILAGGHGGLWKIIPSKMYDFNLAIQLPLSEIIAAAGEFLSPTSTPSRLFHNLPHWVRKEDEAGNQISDLSKVIGANWRVLKDGSIFFGNPSFEEQKTDNFFLQDHKPEILYSDFTTVSTSLQPGQSIKIYDTTYKIACINYCLSDQGTSAYIWYHDPKLPAPEDPLHAGFSKYIREVMSYIDYHALYPGKVVLQRANGSIDVVLDSKKLPPLTSVPIRVPAPGAKIKVTPGSRVLVSFENGNPTQYSALLYEQGSGGRPIARLNDTVNCGQLIFKFTPPRALSVTYAPPGGQGQEGLTVNLQGIITSGSDIIELN